jgi:DNA-binding LacI/PurR family transcriptional regulator
MAHITNATMKDIAKSLNVSVTTVSKVINGHKDISEKMRREVLDKIVEMGTSPNIMAANLRRNKASVVALVSSDISKPYFARVIAGYERVFEAAGYHIDDVQLMERGETGTTVYPADCRDEHGGHRHRPGAGQRPGKNRAQASGNPYVFSNRFLDAASDYYVAADNEMAGYLATRHLLERKPEPCVLYQRTRPNLAYTTRYADIAARWPKRPFRLTNNNPPIITASAWKTPIKRESRLPNGVLRRFPCSARRTRLPSEFCARCMTKRCACRTTLRSSAWTTLKRLRISRPH